METYEVTVTYTVELEDRAALLRAGGAAWRAPAESWAVRVEDDGGLVAISAEEAAAAEPGPEASLAFVLGALGHPSVPGVRFSTMSVDVQPTAAE